MTFQLWAGTDLSSSVQYKECENGGQNQSPIYSVYFSGYSQYTLHFDKKYEDFHLRIKPLIL